MSPTKSGWDGPLEIDYPLLMETAGRELRIAADETTPQSAKNMSDAAKAHRQHTLRASGGTLVRSHRFRILQDQKAIQWTNKKVYAVIQDIGGTIGPYDATKKKGRYLKGNRRTVFGTSGGSGVMLAYIGGGWRFFTKRKGFTLRAQNYTGKAVDLMLPRLQVRWLKRTGQALAPAATITEAGGD